MLGVCWVCVLGVCLGVLKCAWGVLGDAKLSCQTFMVDEGEEEERKKKTKVLL